jgi:hypothetical protein
MRSSGVAPQTGRAPFDAKARRRGAGRGEIRSRSFRAAPLPHEARPARRFLRETRRLRASAWKNRTCIRLAAPLAAMLALAGCSAYSQRSQGEIPMPEAAAFRILFGVTDSEPAKWDGTVRATRGTVLRVEGWRFAPPDAIKDAASWTASTRLGVKWPPGNPNAPLLDNGVIVFCSAPAGDAGFQVTTAQGNFEFAASGLPYGAVKRALGGRVVIDRVPAVTKLTATRNDQDFPAIARSGDDLYVSYVEFTQADPQRAGGFAPLRSAPPDFRFLSAPTGGDRVKLLHYSVQARRWSAPMDVSAPGQDVMRAAAAVDGNRRVWVIWSANRDGNFDLYAKVLSRGRWSAEMRLTHDPGPDLSPVAATDSGGRVWVAWQGLRRDNFEILSMAQQGDRFGPETVVSVSPYSDWDPAIAASPTGDVAIAWDTYDRGDYDVFVRRLKMAGDRIQSDAPVTVAASSAFEARSDVAFDAQGRLWVAYEHASRNWGKDWGVHETSGVPLYMSHQVRVRCLEGGRLFATGDELAELLPVSNDPTWGRGRRPVSALEKIPLPNPDWPSGRQSHEDGRFRGELRARSSFPRIAPDGRGGIYLGYRRPAGGYFSSAAGSAWISEFLWWNGEAWRGPVILPSSDGDLENRPALCALPDGKVLTVAAGDHRMQPLRFPGVPPRGGVKKDLFASELSTGMQAVPPQLQAAAGNPKTGEADAQAERQAVRRMREYRANVNGVRLQLLRGEFHRHTELSGDGLDDGTLVDAYRYAIDAASMDWFGCCDHDAGNREYSWWMIQKYTDAFHLGSRFVTLFNYERSVQYPEGHRNVLFEQRGIRPLPRLPKAADDSPPEPAADTQMFYRYVREFNGLSSPHTSGTTQGTDWRDNDPAIEPWVEIYQPARQSYEREGAPRAVSEADGIAGYRPKGFVAKALLKGLRLGFQASSDHWGTHMAYANVWVSEKTRRGVLEAIRQRRVYGATDNILADVRCGEHFMGEEFSVKAPPVISVKLWGTAGFAKVHVIKDDRYVHTVAPGSKEVSFTWKDMDAAQGKTSYYYVRGEQKDGELVWVSPMWITRQ